MRVYHFMRYKWWFLGSLGAVTVFAVLAIFALGLDFGIDFKGGVRMQFSLQQDASVDQVRQVVTDAGVFEPVVQSVGTPGTSSAFMVTAQEMKQPQIDAVKAALASDFGLDAKSTAVEQVGASFGKSTTNMAFVGVAIAIVFIIGYLWLRFELKFAIPAILALLHDVGLTLGIYAASQRQDAREHPSYEEGDVRGHGGSVHTPDDGPLHQHYGGALAAAGGHPDLWWPHSQGLCHGPDNRRIRRHLFIVLCCRAPCHHLERKGTAIQEASGARDGWRFGRR
jgi:hypothetical protein